ncbi:hypothetical protein HC928_11780 [bacterium]|nr:hypothetical protein [bacterium]
MLESQWDLSGVLSWFHLQIDASSALFKPVNDIHILSSESLAQAVARIQQRDFNDQNEEDRMMNCLYAFRKCHCLRFQLRGADIPDLFIGRNRGNGEISLSSNVSEWKYCFDIDDFVNHFRLEISNFESAYSKG